MMATFASTTETPNGYPSTISRASDLTADSGEPIGLGLADVVVPNCCPALDICPVVYRRRRPNGTCLEGKGLFRSVLGDDRDRPIKTVIQPNADDVVRDMSAENSGNRREA